MAHLDMLAAELVGPPPPLRRPENLVARMLAMLFVYQSLLPWMSHAEKVASVEFQRDPG